MMGIAQPPVVVSAAAATATPSPTLDL